MNHWKEGVSLLLPAVATRPLTSSPSEAAARSFRRRRTGAGLPVLPRGHVSVPRCRAVPLNQFQFGLVSASAARPSLGAGAREGEAVASEASGRRRAVLSLPLAGPRFPRRRTGKERRPGPARFPASLRHSSSGTRVPGSVPNARDTMGRE